ncbi:MAG: hypothetical protein IPK21_15460 [Haliscomenobacter sp.]|nr:hypothetical protein [Haliscomenobacter sp.]
MELTALEDSLQVTIFPELAHVLVIPDQACVKEPIHFGQLSLSNGVAIHWDFGDGTSSKIIDPFHTYADMGSYLVIAHIWNHVPGDPSQVSCQEEIKKMITVLAPPNIQTLAFEINPCIPSNQIVIASPEDYAYADFYYEFCLTYRKNGPIKWWPKSQNQSVRIEKQLLILISEMPSKSGKKTRSKERKGESIFTRWFNLRKKIRPFKPEKRPLRCPFSI